MLLKNQIKETKDKLTNYLKNRNRNLYNKKQIVWYEGTGKLQTVLVLPKTLF